MAIERVTVGPAAMPEGIMATIVKVYVGDPDAFSEEISGTMRTFRKLPGGALWPMPADYVLPHVYRTFSVVRYYMSKTTWIEDGIKFEERPYALTT